MNTLNYIPSPPFSFFVTIKQHVFLSNILFSIILSLTCARIYILRAFLLSIDVLYTPKTEVMTNVTTNKY